MTEQEIKFLELAKEYEKAKEAYKSVSEKLTESMNQLKVGTYLQDPETLAVYKIVKPEGHYVVYRELDFHRTSIGDEKRGSLSKKEATEAGFDLVNRLPLV